MARVSVLRPLMTVAVVMSVLVGVPAHAVGTNPASGAAAMQLPPSSFSAADAFHWLDPIAPSSGDTARLDAALLNYLTVEVCEVTNAGCPTVRTFTSRGASSEQLRIVKTGNAGGYYIVNWDTRKAKISLTTSYQIIVSMPGGCRSLRTDQLVRMRRCDPWLIWSLTSNGCACMAWPPATPKAWSSGSRP